MTQQTTNVAHQRDETAGSRPSATQLPSGLGPAWSWLVGFVTTPGRLIQFARYLVVSVVALGVDIAAFWMLVASGGVAAVAAGAAGVLAGLIVHYTLSVFFVFADQDTGKSQRRLISEYVLTGGAGVLITSAVIFAVVDLAGLPPFAGKGVAVVITFVVVYIMRAGYVFNGGRPDVDAIITAPEPMASGR